MNGRKGHIVPTPHKMEKAQENGNDDFQMFSRHNRYLKIYYLFIQLALRKVKRFEYKEKIFLLE